MASSLLSRRLSHTTTFLLRNPSSLLHLLPSDPTNPSSSPIAHLLRPHSGWARRLSTPTSPGPAPSRPGPVLRHQEITGPTVERDASPLAEETRRTLHSLRQAVRDLSVAAALLGAAHLALGAWIAYAAPEAPREVAVQGVAAFAFPFAAAFLVRRALKPLGFLGKMEDMGRLQILTLALQSSKTLRSMLLRTRILALACALGVSVGSVAAIWTR